MSKLLQHLNMLAICLLGGVLASVLLAQIRPGTLPSARAVAAEDEWVWPKTLQVYPAHPGDPLKLVKVTKAGKELLPGVYRIPEIAGDFWQNLDAVKGWLTDISFTLKSQTSKNIVSAGIAVVFPVRSTDGECNTATNLEAWCRAHPHWCDGGCPTLKINALHWGSIPGIAASGLEARFRAEARGIFGDRVLLQGKHPLRLAPGEEATLSLADGVEEGWGGLDPRAGVPELMNGIVFREGLEEAKNTEPCLERRRSKTGCAFAEVSKFNIAVQVVYFEDGTIWGNYGYGYALPNPDGIFTRVDAHDVPGMVSPGSAAN